MYLAQLMCVHICLVAECKMFTKSVGPHLQTWVTWVSYNKLNHQKWWLAPGQGEAELGNSGWLVLRLSSARFMNEKSLDNKFDCCISVHSSQLWNAIYNCEPKQQNSVATKMPQIHANSLMETVLITRMKRYRSMMLLQEFIVDLFNLFCTKWYFP